MTNLRIPFLTLTALAVLLLSCGCSPQQEKLGPCPNEFESHTPIYDRDTILFHYESFNHEAIDEIPPTPEGSGGGPFAVPWALVGTVEDFDGAGIAKIKVTGTNQAASFSTLHISTQTRLSKAAASSPSETK